MDTLTNIKSRRSIRLYKDKKLTTEQIYDIITYGLYAPSAHNQQAWKYFIITKKEDQIFLSEIMEFGKMLANAGGAILACFDENNIKSKEFIQQDMGASIQTILLAANEKNIGSVWLGVYPHQNEMEKIKNYFNLADNIVPFALISLGIKQGEPPEKTLKTNNKIEII